MSYVEAITTADLEFGHKVWDALRDNRKFPISGMLWLFEPDAGQWHLLIASPVVDKIGPRDAYREFAKITRRIPESGDQLLRIELVSPKHPLYEALRSVFGQTAPVEGARLGKSYVGGMYIDDAYLYGVR